VPSSRPLRRYLAPELTVASAGHRSGLGLSPGQGGQTCITEHFQRRSRRARPDNSSGEAGERGLKPYCHTHCTRGSSTPPPPANVTMDLTYHYPRTLLAQLGWEILIRNGQTIITPPMDRQLCHLIKRSSACCVRYTALALIKKAGKLRRRKVENRTAIFLEQPRLSLLNL
jgi:hypothetical protein